jgi:hypothetical protein
MTPPTPPPPSARRSTAQWAIPALTGAMLLLSARMSEQQRPAEVVKGLIQRLNPAA